MSVDESRRSISPQESSGRVSPAQRSTRRHEDVIEPRRQDKNYRRYAAGIERALASFDSTRLEWPDYISFLGRLLKAIQAHPPALDSLPHKSNIANRLAQCLRPTLPSGVHQKAIEVYSFIFSLIGKQALAYDLPVYLPGLVAVFTFASLSLRPTFLTLLETHILPVDVNALRPALKALILCLLPGLEDETSEDFSRSLKIVDALREAGSTAMQDVDLGSSTKNDEYFWQCFFLASISSPSRRQGALAFLTKRLPKLITPNYRNNVSNTKINGRAADSLSPNAEAVISPEPGLLIRCMAAGLEDEQMLVKRGYLDLLLSHLPLHSPVLTSRVEFNDLARLVAAATSVVARRDMSLNRRLWTWFLGPSNTDETEDESNSDTLQPTASSRAAEYFAEYGAEPLVATLLDLFNERPTLPSERARPFRMCLSLMDHGEVGGIVIPKIFLAAMESISDYSKQANDVEFQEVLRSANSFFDGIESGTIWGQIMSLTATTLVSNECDDDDTRFKNLTLAHFIIQNFNIHDEEMLFVHVPMVLLALIAATSEYNLQILKTLDHPETPPVLGEALLLGDLLVHLLPERLHLNSSIATKKAIVDDPGEGSRQGQIVSLIESFYSGPNRLPSLSPPPFSSKDILELLLSEAVDLLLSQLRKKFELNVDPFQANIGLQAKLLSSLILKLPTPDLSTLDKIVNTLDEVFVLHKKIASGMRLEFDILKAISQLLVAISSVQQTPSKTYLDTFSHLLSHVAEGLWEHLSPSTPKHHLEAIRCLWQLDDLIFGESLIEALVAAFLIDGEHEGSRFTNGVDPARKFSILWFHTSSLQTPRSRHVAGFWLRSSSVGDKKSGQEDQSYQQRLFRPLCLLLDACDESETELQYFLQSWLQNLPNIDRIVEMLVANILKTRPLSVGSQPRVAEIEIEHENQSHLCLYYSQRLSTLLGLSSTYLWSSLSFAMDNMNEDDKEEESNRTALEFLGRQCILTIKNTITRIEKHQNNIDNSLLRTTLSILCKIFQSPDPLSLQRLKLEDDLTYILSQSLNKVQLTSSCQMALLDTILAALRVRHLGSTTRTKTHRPTSSIENAKNLSKLSLHQEVYDSSPVTEPSQSLGPPPQLIKCLQEGLTSHFSVHSLEKWVQFLSDVLPLLASALFQSIIPLVESICRRIKSMFQDLKNLFDDERKAPQVSPEGGLMALLNALELTLITGHDQMTTDEPRRTGPRSPELQQGGFFGTVVSGVFSSEGHRTRNATPNTRLTVILCFQDALRLCLLIWSWGGQSHRSEDRDGNSLASFAYVSQRLRNKTRRMLDRMFAEETLECLEAVMAVWMNTDQLDGLHQSSPISLLHVLEESAPKRTIPTIFNAIYSRTIPSSMDGRSISTLTSDLTEFEISQFLIEYTRSLDDDAMDEIWTDCMTFLRDILTNPIAHHFILANLLMFIVILAEKVDKTNFGEQRKMRKDLGDLFLRYLTAVFTGKSGGSYQDVTHGRSDSELPEDKHSVQRRTIRKPQYTDLITVLREIVPRLTAVLGDNDRLSTAVSNITTNAISPLVHAKTFPPNVKTEYLTLWLSLARVTVDSKLLKKDISDAFMHSKFFSIEPKIAASHWSPLLYQWMLMDKDRLADICSRISAPTSAGIMFGVGATAARLEADKKTQLNVRRIAFLILAADEEHAVPLMSTLEEKIVDLLNASIASSPSSATRAEVFMLIRALILKTNSMHLASLWPILTFEMQKALSSVMKRSADFDTYNTASLLQACKLLDTLLALNPEDFQVHEWLFITDTIDAVYRPSHWEPVALADDLAEELGETSTGLESIRSPAAATRNNDSALVLLSRTNTDPLRVSGKYRVPLLSISNFRSMRATNLTKEEFIGRYLRPFLAQLSLHAYESTYSMKGVDVDACITGLIEDLFDDSTLVG